MTAHLTARRTLAAAAGTLLVTAVWAAPAAAHGALTNPVSRVAMCGPVGGRMASSAACKAAIAASGGQAFADWDNLRVADVNGRDREVIPDGKLCSGGIARYRGLDLARADWPATKLTPGAQFTFRYQETIPHEGSFRLYVTKDGYDPKKPLRWSDLESKPFLSVTDPPLRDEAYTFKGKLPAGKTGRHLIYTIWQNSSTADTYYSCSDVDFTKPAAAAARVPATKSPRPTPSPSPSSPPSSQSGGQSVARLGPADPVSAERDDGTNSTLPLVAVAAAVLAAFGVTAVALVLRRRRSLPR
jgi:predicted carbohydrate-binding protein with CBM5 and CBM33 domain